MPASEIVNVTWKEFLGAIDVIEAQLKASSTLFKNAFSGEDFKKNAREYLRERMLIS